MSARVYSSQRKGYNSMKRQSGPSKPNKRRLVLGVGALAVALLVAVGIGVTVNAGGNQGWTSPSQKQQALGETATQEAQAAQTPHASKPKQTAPIQAPASCPDAPPAGVNAPGIGGEQFKQDYIVNTANAYPTDKTPVVYVLGGGAQLSNMRQGVIGVQMSPIDTCAPNHPAAFFHIYDTPYQAGAVTLVSINGDLIAFTTKDGRSGNFNFVTGAFS